MVAFNVLLLLAVLFCSVQSTKVRKCKGTFIGKVESVVISSCEDPPCMLKKNTSPTLEMKFVPDSEVKQVKNHVSARISGLTLPFLGVDGSSACGQIYLQDGTTPPDCLLTPGIQYVYKNTIDVLPFYPSVSPLVRWSLVDGSSGQGVACFEIPIKIFN